MVIKTHRKSSSKTQMYKQVWEEVVLMFDSKSDLLHWCSRILITLELCYYHTNSNFELFRYHWEKLIWKFDCVSLINWSGLKIPATFYINRNIYIGFNMKIILFFLFLIFNYIFPIVKRWFKVEIFFFK